MSLLDPEELTTQKPEIQIDLASDAFLNSWKRGERPRVSEFASLVSPNLREQLLRELIITEQQLQQKQIASEKQLPTQDGSTCVGEKDTIKRQVAIPTQIAHYQPRYVLGYGASGVVYASLDTISQRMVALKLPHAHLVASQEDTNRFLREARNAEHLKHPGIVEFLQVGNTEAGPFIVYEFLNGIDLRSYLRAGIPLTLEAKLRIIADTARAIQYAHDQGLVHRDLKPANLMVLTPEPAQNTKAIERIEIKVLDFGIAKLETAGTILTSAGEMLGTPGYMSPEQASGQSQSVGHRADTYSLGVILYELLTGSTPFKGNDTQLVEQIRHEEVPLLQTSHPEIPAPVVTICHRCLRLNPTRRYSKIADVAEDIERYLQGDSILAKPVGLLERTHSTWKRHQLSRIAATACLAICLTVLGFTVWQVSRPTTAIVPIEKSSLQMWVDALPKSLEDPIGLIEALPSASVEDLTVFVKDTSIHRNAIVEICERYQKDNSKKLPKSEEDLIHGTLLLLNSNRSDDIVCVEALAAWIRERIVDQDVLAWQQLLGPLGKLVSKPLEAGYRIESLTVKRKALSRLLANIHQNDVNALTRFLDRANPDEILTWANAIGKDRMESLSIPWEDFDTDEGYLPIKEPVCIKYANWAIARHALGNSDWLFRAFEDRPDPRVRTYSVHRFPESELAIETLIDRIFVETNADVIYGLLMAIAIADPKSIKSSDFPKAKAWVLQNYETHPDSGVHGMCRTLIVRWEMESEVLEVDRRLIEAGPDRKKSWFINSVGMHMAIIKGNVAFWMGKPKGEKAEYAALSYEDGHISRIDKSYAIGMDEVTVGQYRLFDPFFLPDVGQASSVSNVSKLDCDQFCAWLTRQEMLDEVESQYSLPESYEWEYASRGKTVTPRFHGNFETSISTSFYVSSITDSVGFLLPNRYGLVSSIGSVAEWTKTIGMESKTKGYELCFVRGGNSGFDQMESMRSNTSCARSMANTKGSTIGMRIVWRNLELD